MRFQSSRVCRAGPTAVIGLGLLASLLLPAAPAMAQAGGITDNSGLIPFQQSYFAFEVESVLSTMKEVPIWDELEQMLDDPYGMSVEPGLPLNEQGFLSYRSTLPRRRSFVFRDGAGQPCAPGSAGCVEIPLARHVVHPLNYNHMNGEELHLLNIDYAGGEWTVPDVLTGPFPDPDGSDRPLYIWTYRPITVSPGIERIEADEAATDFNSPMEPDPIVTIVSTESSATLPEGSLVQGGDPGEPGFAGFGVLLADTTVQYSVPAVPGPTSETDPTVGYMLYDPARGYIVPRDPVTGAGGLRKPSLRIPEAEGTPADPHFLANSEVEMTERAMEAALEEGLPYDPEEFPPAAYLLPSTENDYVAGATRAEKLSARDTAAALGKALFWDMQVGSDGVQSCGSCHFHAGVDNRTRNQLNPNHLGGDLALQLHGGVANQELTAADFPFHDLVNNQIPGERASDGDGIVDNNPGNVLRHVNDVASSMGVFFSPFSDILTPGATAFVTDPATGIPSLLPDLFTPSADPIPLFQGLRRVEPRNTPTLFAATMNFDNFWDGRARHDFNGGSVFGASDPQSHVMVDDGLGGLVPTRQIIRFASLASLATGPALSEFEMSRLGRNWSKLGKKLLQSGVVPLANQLVATDDSFLGPYSNQGGSWCTASGRPTAADLPGLCISYPELIQMSFYPALWSNTTAHLEGCYTDGNVALHPNQCGAGSVAIPILSNDMVVDSAADPFDNYVLALAPGAAVAGDTNQFTQMEANFSLFWGLSIHMWGQALMPDDTPMDRFYDENPESFVSFGEANEPFLVLDLLTCGDVNPSTGLPQGQPCLTEVGNFKRDAGLMARLNCTVENCDNPGAASVPVSGTRQPGDPDPLLGMDFFLGSNLSLKNPRFRSLRCGECHAGGTLTDHTVEISHQFSFNDFVQEFGVPGQEAFPEPLGRSRVITGFALESETNGNAQDGIERNISNFALDEGGFPQGQALFDNGVYNIGVTPIATDVSRGGPDAFGWPLSLGILALKNIGGVDYHPGGNNPANGFALPLTPGNPLPTFDPSIDPTGGRIFEPTAQDQQINPGFEEEVDDGMLPPYLAPWASNINVGDESNQDEVFIGLNTLCAEPILEGFMDAFGPFNPAAVVGEAFNSARQPEMATWPIVNRVNHQGSFKAAALRNVEMSGPYFHNGGKLTLRQVVDFYMRGGDFPATNDPHRDFLIANLNVEDEALGGVDLISGLPLFDEQEKEQIRVALVEFLLELTDERVAFERAPFDHPELFVPLDGTAPENTFGRSGFLGDPRFRQVSAVGMGGNATQLPNFLGISSVKGDPGLDHFDSDTSWAVPEAQADLRSFQDVSSLAKAMLLPGDTVTFGIRISNAGPFNISDAQVSDIFPAGLTGVSWTCQASGGMCGTAVGTGSIADAVDLPVASWVTYTVSAVIDASAAGQQLINTVNVSSIVTDPDESNNSSSAVVTVINPVEVPLFWDDVETGDTSKWSGAYPFAP